MSVNAISTSTAGAGSMGGYLGMGTTTHDSEYEAVKKKLKKLGLNVTGKKDVDKSTLANAEKQIEKMVERAQKRNKTAQVETEVASSQMSGATNLANLNKLLFGIS